MMSLTQKQIKKALIAKQQKELNKVYKDPKCLAEMMKKITETHDQYYISSDGTVLIKSNTEWVPYHLIKDSRLSSPLLDKSFEDAMAV